MTPASLRCGRVAASPRLRSRTPTSTQRWSSGAGRAAARRVAPDLAIVLVDAPKGTTRRFDTGPLAHVSATTGRLAGTTEVDVRVIDVAVEGVSLVVSNRSEFDSVVNRQAWAALIAQSRGKAERRS